MSYHLRAGASIAAELRRLAADPLDRASGELDDPDAGRDEAVHQLRKRCRKLCGLLRLVRPALGEETCHRENRALREAFARRRDDDEAEPCDARFAAHGA